MSIEKRLRELAAEVVHVGQFDYAGIFRERRFRTAPFLEWANDPRFANVVAYWGPDDSLFAGSRYFTERQAIDETSIRRHPAEANAVAVICEMQGEAGEVMPRRVLRRQIERAADMGYDVDAAFEFEFILLAETAETVRERGFENLRKHAPDNRCWSGTTAAVEADLIAGLEAEILGFDIPLHGLGVELGPGCLEATLGAARGLKAADDACFFRLAARSYARRNGLTASFMPYLGRDYPGIGGHVCLSLRDRKTGKNLFADTAGTTSLLARRFIAGMMALVPEAFAMCTSTVNAYRRLAPGSWAPKAVTWAEYTFTTAVRSVPSAGDGARLEFRSPPADCNPYLALALMLGAGLDGIEQNMDAPAATEAMGLDDIPPGAARFPADLREAAARLETSARARQLFGDAFIDNFVIACRAEDNSLRTAVSAEERRRYLEG